MRDVECRHGTAMNPNIAIIYRDGNELYLDRENTIREFINYININYKMVDISYLLFVSLLKMHHLTIGKSLWSAIPDSISINSYLDIFEHFI